MRSITFALPLLFRGSDLDLRISTHRERGIPQWPIEGAKKSLTVVVEDGSRESEVDFAIFSKGRPVLHGVVTVHDKKIFYGDQRILPVLGYRTLTDVQIVPGLSRAAWLR